MTPFELLAATIAARIIDKAHIFDAYGPRDNEDTDDEGRLWLQAVDPLTSAEIEIAPPGFGYSFEMWRPEATSDEEAEAQFADEKHDAEDIAHSIAFGIVAARRIEARKLARLNLLRARIMRDVCAKYRLTSRGKPGGLRQGTRADFAMRRIEKMIHREYIDAIKAEREPIH